MLLLFKNIYKLYFLFGKNIIQYPTKFIYVGVIVYANRFISLGMIVRLID